MWAEGDCDRWLAFDGEFWRRMWQVTAPGSRGQVAGHLLRVCRKKKEEEASSSSRASVFLFWHFLPHFPPGLSIHFYRGSQRVRLWPQIRPVSEVSRERPFWDGKLEKQNFFRLKGSSLQWQTGKCGERPVSPDIQVALRRHQSLYEVGLGVEQTCLVTAELAFVCRKHTAWALISRFLGCGEGCYSWGTVVVGR